MRFEVSDSLLDDEVRIRTEVFVEEQGFTDEFDDGVNDAIHIVLYDGDAPVATCCYTLASTDAPAEIKRVAVVRGRRGGSLGTLAVREAERQFSAVGGGEMLVVAQVRAKGFYERLGYAASGDEFPIEGCPHIRMWKAVPAHRFEIFDAPSDDEVRIRTEVFIDEQGFEAEFDDDDAVSKHIVLYEGGVPVAVCRIIPDGDSCHIGRVAVVRDHRGMGLGSVIVREAERVAGSMGFRESLLSAQVRAKGFYETLGYEAFGDEYLDEYCPHVMMRKRLRTVTGR